MLELRVYHREYNGSYTASLIEDVFGATADTVLNNFTPCNYLTFDGAGVDLLDENLRFYENGDYTGYTLNEISDGSGEINYYNNYSACMRINTANQPDAYPNRITIQFKDYCCSEILIKYYDAVRHAAVEEQTIAVADKYTTIEFSRGYGVVEIYFTKTVYPNQYVRIESVVYGGIDILNEFTNSELIEKINVLSNDLPINQFDCTAIIRDGGLNFSKGDGLNIFNGNKFFGTYYIADINRNGKYSYDISAENLISGLDKGEYYSWKSSNTDLCDFLPKISPKISVESDLNFTMFGYIPVKTKRFALCAACWGCGLMVDGSRSNIINLRPIPTEITSTILNSDRRIIGDAVFKKTTQYGSAEITYPYAFEYETGSITFENCDTTDWNFYYLNDAPVVIGDPDKEIQYESGYNYIRFRTKYPKVTFECYKLKYFDTTEHAYNNDRSLTDMKTFNDFQIRGGVIINEHAVERISRVSDVEKYIKSQGTVTAKIRLRDEKVGDLIQIETAWDGIITGIITQMTISFGYENIADIEVMEWSL